MATFLEASDFELAHARAAIEREGAARQGIRATAMQCRLIELRFSLPFMGGDCASSAPR
jgi:hypothetical protein